jgi:hypothetical protein
MLQFKNLSQTKKDLGFSYLGSVSKTTKHIKSLEYNELVYTIYLSPANISGYEVCPMRNQECTDLCLNESGHNRMSSRDELINKSRIGKTKLFFENREYFIKWMMYEIDLAKLKAEKQGFNFSVRINNTSDINPISFYIDVDGKKLNILELFPDVQFYDYTKVPNRVNLMKLYPNYDLTFSYDGYNKDTCLRMLEKNVRVAVVFDKLPDTLWGYKVIDGDLYDMRYHDDKNVVIGLKFKKVRKKLNHDYKFVIQSPQ